MALAADEAANQRHPMTPRPRDLREAFPAGSFVIDPNLQAGADYFVRAVIDHAR